MEKTNRLRTFVLTAIAILLVIPWASPLREVGAKVLQFSITRSIQAGGTSSIALNDTGGIALTPTSGQGVAIGGGTPIKKVLSTTASLDFGATAAGTCESLTITVTGANDGDPVYLGIPSALAGSDTYQAFYGFVSSANTVTVKRCNLTNSTTALSNPAAVTIRAAVVQF